MFRFRRMVDDVAGRSLASLLPCSALRRGLRAGLKTAQIIFDWFNCIEITQVETEAGRFRWPTELVACD